MVTNSVKKWIFDLIDDAETVIGMIPHVPSLSVDVVDKPKTNLELAEEILAKNGYCHIHLIKKVFIEDPFATFSGRYVCRICENEEQIRYKLAQEKINAARDLEIEFALNVMRERTVCK